MSEPSQQLSLAVGDRVVYPNQGVCRVSGVEAKEVAGQKLVFVTMRREEDGAVVMVPQTKIAAIGVRKVAGAEDVAQIFAFLKSDSDKADLDWKQRARTNADRMAQGGLQGLAEVVKALQVLSELRPLPAKERELYDTARHLLVKEISVALGIPESDAEDSIDVVLFPVGRDRPKRTAAEFRPGGDDDLDLGDDLLGLEGGELGTDDTVGEEEEAEAETAEQTAEKEEPKKAALSDDDETQPMGAALVPDEQVPPKRKRGRPPKPKPEVDPAAAAAEPKKRGRPPKGRDTEPLIEVESSVVAGKPLKEPSVAHGKPLKEPSVAHGKPLKEPSVARGKPLKDTPAKPAEAKAMKKK